MRRRLTSVELMLLTTILLWSLNLSVTKYLLTHGLEPLSYAIVRYALAGLLFVAGALVIERSLRIERRHLPLVALAAVALWLNQLSFIFALDLTTASTIGLLLGTIPIFAALLGLVLGTERLSRRFWLAAAISAFGVMLVALGAGGEVSASATGIALGLATGLTWAVYSVTAAPLMRHYSAVRMSAAVFPIAWLLIAITRLASGEEQDWSLGLDVWVLLLFATFGPLVVTTVLWFRAIHRIGAARATLAANLQPFVAAVLAVVLLSEPLSILQIAGGALIAAGILAARRRAPAPPAT
ncbi:MAG TPA: DMT family transporter [Gaiellaceae bacterium]|nr:DMT family transporter [Gaiellaceae bacterium]